MLDLETEFSALEPPSHGAEVAFTASQSPLLAGHRIAKDADGQAAFLLTCTPKREGVEPPIRLRYISVLPHQRCLLSRPDGLSEGGEFTVIRCLANDVEITTYFLRVMGNLVTGLGPRPTEAAIRVAVQHAAEIFHALTDNPTRTVQGLWAELFLITVSQEPLVLLNAWRAGDSDKFDFSSDRHRIEVKSSSRGLRAHHFALDQLSSVEGGLTVVASLLLWRAGGGTSIAELVDRVHERLAGDTSLAARLEHTVATSLGADWRESTVQRFDSGRAQDSLRFYDARTVPQIQAALPGGVSEVEFMSDLSECPPLPASAMLDQGDLAAAVVPFKGLRR